MTPSPRPLLFHHHGFKCAGTTFANVLDRNFPGAVLYVESTHESDRLPWQTVAESLAVQTPRAVSSHLATIPPRGQALARLHVAFVRRPADRLISAFRFEQTAAGTVPYDESFVEYQTRVRFTEVSNYQTRHLSVQDFGSWPRRQGWEARPELISFSRPDFFVGVVERIEESLLVLERRLNALGVAFDAAYPQAENVAPRQPRLQDALRGQVFSDMVELDEVLYARAETALASACRALGIGADEVAAFRDRCAELADRGEPAVATPPEHWTYLRATAPPSVDA